ncbi:hypothetical protein PMI01_02937 [Caulobacter sp. AP07]|uniref:hypothetical protein n=1 Tax=Caulobacter sp. AP07 TaxID=1144304 RepID=UPI000271DEF9|nr:hypothetical protein [Caulobacter sp. AP07]EJL31002.1 hypothetical protein PMI01_02937 [Caulobacter sp. AP07]
MTFNRETELHDAVLTGVLFDPLGGTATIDLKLYATPGVSERTPGRIVFSGVRHFTATGDVAEMQRNAAPGNVNYWRCGGPSGCTHIHLVDGHISIQAEKVETFLLPTAP